MTTTPRMRLTLALTALACLVPLAFPAGAQAATVWAVGDGADWGTDDDAVASLIEQRGAHAFLYLGDVYETGSAAEFANYYAPGFGRLKAVTKPTPGNHEWDKRAEGYDAYWGPVFTAPHYYSFDLGGWRLLSLNSEEPSGEGSAQLAWLRQELGRRSGDCTLAYMHKPRYSAGVNHGDDAGLAVPWSALTGHTSIVLAGHDHSYQRMRPIDGITSFIVGTGGHGHVGVHSSDARLAAHNATDYGALRLELSSGRADFAFVSVTGAVLDSGSVSCDPIGKPLARDSTRPVLSRLLASRKVVGHGDRGRIVFRYSLSEKARSTFTLKRMTRRGAVALRTLAQNGRPGFNTKAFSGTHAGKPLRAGVYKVFLLATDKAGNVSRVRRVSFRVLQRRRR